MFRSNFGYVVEEVTRDPRVESGAKEEVIRKSGISNPKIRDSPIVRL